MSLSSQQLSGETEDFSEFFGLRRADERKGCAFPVEVLNLLGGSASNRLAAEPPDERKGCAFPSSPPKTKGGSASEFRTIKDFSNQSNRRISLSHENINRYSRLFFHFGRA
jgi:hypothetical protein